MAQFNFLPPAPNFLHFLLKKTRTDWDGAQSIPKTKVQEIKSEVRGPKSAAAKPQRIGSRSSCAMFRVRVTVLARPYRLRACACVHGTEGMEGDAGVVVGP